MSDKSWRILAHPLFLEQLNTLVKEVEQLKQKHPKTYQQKNATKRLFAILKLVNETIPADPTNPVYRQGATLGNSRKHWFRAKFYQQYRLFFRYNLEERIIIFVWVNDTKSKRAYGSKTDAYRTFAKMLDSGNPPERWTALIKASQDWDQSQG